MNDVTVIGDPEPRAYVRDYFVGNGVSTRFYLSQPPFTKHSTTVFDEEYSTPALDPTRWSVSDPAHAVVVGSGKLQIAEDAFRQALEQYPESHRALTGLAETLCRAGKPVAAGF